MLDASSRSYEPKQNQSWHVFGQICDLARIGHLESLIPKQGSIMILDVSAFQCRNPLMKHVFDDRRGNPFPDAVCGYLIRDLQKLEETK